MLITMDNIEQPESRPESQYEQAVVALDTLETNSIVIYPVTAFDKNVLGKNFSNTSYRAGKLLIDSVNNTITVIYLSITLDIISVKYYETHVERQTYSTLRDLVELDILRKVQPDNELINEMLKCITRPFDKIQAEYDVAKMSHLYEYSIRDIRNQILDYTEKSTGYMDSTRITSAYLLDDLLMRMYSVFDLHTRALKTKLVAAKYESDVFRQYFDRESKMHQATRDNEKVFRADIDKLERLLHEANYDNKSTKEKLLASEKTCESLKSSATYIGTETLEMQDKLQKANMENLKLTAENKRLHSYMHKFQTSIAAISYTMGATL